MARPLAFAVVHGMGAQDATFADDFLRRVRARAAVHGVPDGDLMAEFPGIAEVEINPLRVLPDGQGAVAVDVRLRVGAHPA